MNNKDKTKESKGSFRGITTDFANALKDNPVFQEFYIKHTDKVIVGIRDNYINLYYNCDSIAMIEDGEGPLKAMIDPYYLGLKTGKKGMVEIKPQEYDLSSLFNQITERSDARKKKEKQSQETLYIDNNNNSLSDWFCIDVEYTRSLAGKDTAEPWRFDIIAVSKTLPHRVALVELKYGFGALGGKSGIAKHVSDFYDFHKNNSYQILLPELVSIINGLNELGVGVPACIISSNTESNYQKSPEYYFITLNNNPDPKKSPDNTPQMTISGYLFKDKKWGCRRVSSKVDTTGFNAVVKGDTSFKPTFFFAKAVLPDLGIDNVIDSPLYEIGEY